MAAGAMDAFQQLLQLDLEDFVVVRTTQPALGLAMEAENEPPRSYPAAPSGDRSPTKVEPRCLPSCAPVPAMPRPSLGRQGSALFELLDAIAEAGGVLVSFLGDGLVQLL